MSEPLNNKLIIDADSDLDSTLWHAWNANRHDLSWEDYLVSIGEGLISAEWHRKYTLATFESEEHKNWFLLRHK